MNVKLMLIKMKPRAVKQAAWNTRAEGDTFLTKNIWLLVNCIVYIKSNSLVIYLYTTFKIEKVWDLPEFLVLSSLARWKRFGCKIDPGGWRSSLEQRLHLWNEQKINKTSTRSVIYNNVLLLHYTGIFLKVHIYNFFIYSPMMPKMSRMLGTKMTSRLTTKRRHNAIEMWRTQWKGLSGNRSWRRALRI